MQNYHTSSLFRPHTVRVRQETSLENSQQQRQQPPELAQQTGQNLQHHLIFNVTAQQNNQQRFVQQQHQYPTLPFNFYRLEYNSQQSTLLTVSTVRRRVVPNYRLQYFLPEPRPLHVKHSRAHHLPWNSTASMDPSTCTSECWSDAPNLSKYPAGTSKCGFLGHYGSFLYSMLLVIKNLVPFYHNLIDILDDIPLRSNYIFKSCSMLLLIEALIYLL